MQKEKIFTPYQLLVVAILAFLQFTIILDFMVLSPLGAQLLQELNVSTGQFGLVVSVYAFSAGAAGLMTAGFADRFDRKRLLVFFYAGFILGTFLCGIAPNYLLLLAARTITGLFGGVVGTTIFAITTDLFELKLRGRVMGMIQTAFAVSQVLGLPLGLYLANIWDWHAPFLLIAGLGSGALAIIAWKLQPVNAHLALHKGHSAWTHLQKTISHRPYVIGFATTALLATGGFMLMPFGSAFAVNNLGITMQQLPLVYMVTGICSMIAGPLIGRLSDRFDKYTIFIIGSIASILLVLIYTSLGVTPLWILITMNAVLFMAITTRMISSSALMSAIPGPADRGAFMGVNSSVAQISGGFASGLAGLMIHQTPGGYIEHYPYLGFTVALSMAIVIGMMYFINRHVQQKHATEKLAAEEAQANADLGSLVEL